MEQFKVTKASGERVEFESKKLLSSLRRVGANDEDARKVLDSIVASIDNGITTRQIYRLAFAALRKIRLPLAAKYKVKQAIYELGPSGYPFEMFIGELLKYQGYEVEVGKMVKGFSVNHEVDVVAVKDNRSFMIECKFHSDGSKKSNVKIPLYIDSRFRDIERELNKSGDTLSFDEGWIVTNTRFTSDALDYGNCYGIRMISWDNPKVGNLKDRIHISGLYPITCLISMRKREKKQLLDKGVVLCQKLLKQPKMLDELKIIEPRKSKIIEELRELTLT